jgi:hypothetical protein
MTGFRFPPCGACLSPPPLVLTHETLAFYFVAISCFFSFSFFFLCCAIGDSQKHCFFFLVF